MHSKNWPEGWYTTEVIVMYTSLPLVSQVLLCCSILGNTISIWKESAIMTIMALKQLRLAVIPSFICLLIIYMELPVVAHYNRYYWLVLCDTVLHKNLILLNFQSTFNKAFNLRTIGISLVKLEQIFSGIVASRKMCLWSSGDIVTMVSLQLWHNKE